VLRVCDTDFAGAPGGDGSTRLAGVGVCAPGGVASQDTRTGIE
jgi:hypothetical protein